jgi:hypothetical protein
MTRMRKSIEEGIRIAALDAETGTLVPLFNPRRDEWRDHFRWDGAVLIGITPVGRATIAVLAINQPIRVAARKTLIEESRYQP